MALQFVRRQIANAAIDATKLDSNAVITAKINNGAVTADKLGADSVITAKIQDDAVTSAKIADGAVVAAALGAGAVLTAALADDAVSSAKIADSAIITALIADDAVTQAKIADNAVGSDQIIANSVTSSEIANNAVTSAQAAIGGSDAVWNYATGKLQLNGVAVATVADVAGQAWKDSVRVVATSNGALNTAYANGQTVDGITLATNDRILLAGQTTGSENGLYVVKASGAPDRAADMPAGAVSGEKAVCVFVREGSANADTSWILSTDGSITVGTTALTFVQQAHLAELSAGTGLSKSGVTISISQGGVTANELGADAVITAKIQDDAVTTAKIADDAITAALIADDAVGSAAIADDAITSALIADNAVVTAGINNGAVTGAKMANDAVKSTQFGMQFKAKSFTGDGSATTFDLDDDVPSDFRAGILAFANGQALKQVANPSNVGEYGISVNSGVIRLTLNDTLSNQEDLVVWHMVDKS